MSSTSSTTTSLVDVHREPLFRHSQPLSETAHEYRHNSVIELVKYIPCLDSVMVIERGTGNVQFYDASTYEITDSLQLPRGAPTAAHYIDSMKAIVFGFGDTVMGVWDLNRDSKTFKQVGGKGRGGE